MHMCVYVWRAETDAVCLLQLLSTSLFLTGLLLGLEFTCLTRLTVQWAQGLCLFLPPWCWGYRFMPPCLAFYVSDEDPNSGLCIYMTNTFPAEPSHQLLWEFLQPIAFKILAHFGHGHMYYNCRCQGCVDLLAAGFSSSYQNTQRTVGCYSFCEFIPQVNKPLLYSILGYCGTLLYANTQPLSLSLHHWIMAWT